MSKKLCVFPNDPLQAYFDKGELKEKYYNPNNFFDEIHFISLTDQDIEVEKIQKIVNEKLPQKCKNIYHRYLR